MKDGDYYYFPGLGPWAEIIFFGVWVVAMIFIFRRLWFTVIVVVDKDSGTEVKTHLGTYCRVWVSRYLVRVFNGEKKSRNLAGSIIFSGMPK